MSQYIFISRLKKRRKSLFFSLGMVITLFIFIQSSSANLCRLKRADERNVCLSQIEDTDYYCSFVYNIALNHMCYAIAQRKLRACTVITDPDIKKRCEDGVQAKKSTDEERLKKQEELARKKALEQERLAKKQNSQNQANQKIPQSSQPQLKSKPK